MFDHLRASRIGVHAVIALLLGACASGGGGGGGGSAPISPPPPPPPAPGPVFPPLAPPHPPGDYPNLSGSEFNANWGPAGINAQVAWQNGATGAGILVGVIDDGIHPSHPELAGRISPASIDINASRNALVTDNSHGSELSSLIAGNYNGAQTVGVAFDATILAVRADNGSGFSSADLANAIDYARQQGVRVINLSLGSDSPSPQVLQDAIRRATQAGIVIVASAGNSGTQGATQPNYPGALAGNASISNGLIMIAGGLNPNGSVNPVSNPPGSSAQWYLTAPGWQIIVPDYGPPGPVPGFQTCGLGPNGDLCRIQGTSYASPHVAGAVALVMDAFPGMTSAQVVDLLFTTADDTGAPGTDSVNGRGRLNVGRAFQPVGPLAVPLAAGTLQAQMPVGVSGAPFGDGLTGNAAWSVAGFDRYRRTFAVDLANNWIAAPGGPAAVAEAPSLWRSVRADNGFSMQVALADDAVPQSYPARLERADLQRNPTRIDAELGHGVTLSFAANGARTTYRSGDAIGHLDQVPAEQSLQITHRLNDALSFAFISESGFAADPPGMAFSGFTQLPAERSATAARVAVGLGPHLVEFTSGRVHDDRGTLGLSWNNLLGQTPEGETRFSSVAWRYRTGGLGLDIEFEHGVSALANTGWLRVDEPITTSAYSVSLQHALTPSWLDSFGGEGLLSLTLSQPLRVEAGRLSFMAPTATKYGRSSLRHEERAFEPIPSGRETRLGLRYQYFTGHSFSAFGEAIYVHEPGHVSHADPDSILRLGVRLAH